MATVFWDAKGVIMLVVLPKRSTITGVYYANLLDQLRTAIREKRRGKLSKGVLLQQDNVRVHTCKVAIDAVERNGYELIQHPAYSPDLAPSDFFLFPYLKKDIRGLHFRSDEEVVTAVEEWVNGKDPDFFSSGLMALEHRWSKCITLRAITSKKKRSVSTGNKLGYLLTHPRIFCFREIPTARYSSSWSHSHDCGRYNHWTHTVLPDFGLVLASVCVSDWLDPIRWSSTPLLSEPWLCKLRHLFR